MTRGLLKVADTFESLASFTADKSITVPVLASFPITMETVDEWKKELGIDNTTNIKTYLAATTYKPGGLTAPDFLAIK